MTHPILYMYIIYSSLVPRPSSPSIWRKKPAKLKRVVPGYEAISIAKLWLK